MAYHADARGTEDSSRSRSLGLKTVTNILAEEQFVETFMKIEVELNFKMNDELKMSENCILKVLNSLSENSLKK